MQYNVKHKHTLVIFCKANANFSNKTIFVSLLFFRYSHWEHISNQILVLFVSTILMNDHINLIIATLAKTCIVVSHLLVYLPHVDSYSAFNDEVSLIHHSSKCQVNTNTNTHVLLQFYVMIGIMLGRLVVVVVLASW